jgi:DNA-directed RNA polymerase specialized sigma24 family protein
MGTSERPANGGIPVQTPARGASVADLVEHCYPAMARVAAFSGAAREDVDQAIRDACLAAGRDVAAESDSRAARSRLMQELIVRVAELEQAAGRHTLWEVDAEPAAAEERFESGSSRWAGFFTEVPVGFDELLGDGPLTAQARAAAETALAELPLAQRVAVVLRDIAGWPVGDIAALFAGDEGDVLLALHDGLSRARRALERVAETEGGAGRG